MTTQITFLGSGDAFATKRYWNSILLEDNILLDASPIVLPHLKMLNRRLGEIEYIFITHSHGDHFLGIPFLYLEYYFKTRRERPLKIVGPSGLESRLEQSFSLCYPDVAENFERPFKVEYFEIQCPGKYEVGRITFEALEMKHYIPTLGYKIRIGEKTLGYSGDTGVCEGLFELIKNVDILILEASLLTGSQEGHLSMENIHELRRRILKQTTLIITHLGGEVPSSKDILVAEDQRRFIVNDHFEK